jgi:3-hydroxybutyryl-CoA dehydrogenase
MKDLGDLGVIGAGFMGSGIAESAARAGARVRLFEPEQAALNRSGSRLSSSLDRAVARGKMDAAAAEALTERISFHTDLDAQ